MTLFTARRVIGQQSLLRHHVAARAMSAAGGLYNSGRKKRPSEVPAATRAAAAAAAGELAAAAMASSGDHFMKGEVLDYSINLRTSRPGTEIKIPYELTLTDSLSEFWQSSFHAQDRINTSTPFARALGLQDRVMPFELVLFLTSAMSHEDSAKVQVGFGRVVYHWPVFAGDTVRKTFQVTSIRNTSDGNHSIITFKCKLLNQRNRLIMSAEKRLLFECTCNGSHCATFVWLCCNFMAVLSPNSLFVTHKFSVPVPESNVTIEPDPLETSQLFRDHLLSKSREVLAGMESHSITPLQPGNLILHTLCRSITFSQSQQLASLARLTHERHYNIRKFAVNTEIYVPAGLVLGLVVSAANRDFHEKLSEEITSVNYVHHLHPEDVVGSISYVVNVDENLPGDLECISVRTIGIKNIDVANDLADENIPMELLTSDKTYTKEVERICKTLCPKLSNKIIAVVDRKIIRQSNRREVFLL